MTRVNMKDEHRAYRCIAKKTGLKIQVIEAVLYEYFELTKERLRNGGCIVIPFFGVFYMKVNCRKRWWGMKEKKSIEIPYHSQIKFDPFRREKDEINGKIISIVEKLMSYKDCSINQKIYTSRYLSLDHGDREFDTVKKTKMITNKAFNTYLKNENYYGGQKKFNLEMPGVFQSAEDDWE